MKLGFTAILGAATAAAAIACSIAPANAFSFGSRHSQVFRFEQDTTIEFNLLETRGRNQSDLAVYQLTGTRTVTDTRTGEVIFRPSGSLVKKLFSEDLGGFDATTYRINPYASDGNWITSEIAAASDTNGDWLGTAGKTYSVSKNSFTFQAGVDYFFGLSSYNSDPNSVNPLYSGSKSQFIASGETATINLVGPDWILNNPNRTIPTKTITAAPGEALILMEDSDFWDNRWGDADYNDFIVSARIVTPEARVPEPSMTLALLGFAAVGVLGSRRHRQRENKHIIN